MRLSEILADARVFSMRLTVPGMGLVTCRPLLREWVEIPCDPMEKCRSLRWQRRTFQDGNLRNLRRHSARSSAGQGRYGRPIRMGSCPSCFSGSQMRKMHHLQSVWGPGVSWFAAGAAGRAEGAVTGANRPASVDLQKFAGGSGEAGPRQSHHQEILLLNGTDLPVDRAGRR